VVLLQEVRATDEILADHLPPGEWHLAHEASETKGRAGVAIASRLPMTAVRIGLKTGVTGDSGRWVEADLETPAGTVTVVSTYVHTGDAGTPRQQQKLRFLDAIGSRLDAWTSSGSLAVVTGDLNVAHREDDLKNWKGNLRKSGFLPEERDRFDRWFAAGHWVDVHRAAHGPGPGPYTWWSWRGKAFDNDAGWRIDYQLASRPLAARAATASVGRAAAYDLRWSDHAAVVVDYDLG
jgi:exodeoxyribonuclease-3